MRKNDIFHKRNSNIPHENQQKNTEVINHIVLKNVSVHAIFLNIRTHQKQLKIPIRLGDLGVYSTYYIHIVVNLSQGSCKTWFRRWDTVAPNIKSK